MLFNGKKIPFKESNGFTSIYDKWLSDSKCGGTNIDNAERSRRRSSAVVPENMKKVHKMVFPDRRLKLREMAGTLKYIE